MISQRDGAPIIWTLTETSSFELGEINFEPLSQPLAPSAAQHEETEH